MITFKLIIEGGAAARTTLRKQARSQGRNRCVAALVQPYSTSLDAGLRQPDAVRAGMACQSTTASQLMNSAMGYGFQGQGQVELTGPMIQEGNTPRDLLTLF